MSQDDFTDPFLRQRYGVKDGRFPSWVIPAVITAVLGGSWLGWSANHYAKPEVRTQLISFKVIDNAAISLRYSVTFKTDSLSHQCRLIARDFSANIVGEITQTFPVGTSSRTQEVLIPTRTAAVNAAIDRCIP
ncbi:MAG: DUF4307 domain-containing protein [Actinomycetes bacterium]